MNIREVAQAEPALLELVEAYRKEFPSQPSFGPPPVTDAWFAEGRILAADLDGLPVGIAKGWLQDTTGNVSLVYVRPDARRRGVGRALLLELIAHFHEQGAERVTLGVHLSNPDALAVWTRLGFTEYRRELITEIGALEQRLARHEAEPSIGAAHIQTDDQSAIERAVGRFVPRLFVSSGTVVAAPRNGWVAVYDAVAAGEPQLLRRLAAELSNITGGVVLSLGVEAGAVVRLVAFERGTMMDEYVSVPEYHGPLPPGDAMALRANPTLLARLTGADPGAIRAVARAAGSPAELPPAAELLTQLAGALGIEGADLGFDEARGLEGAVVVDH